MVDQRRQIIDEIHKLNILLIHTKLKTTRARTVARATTHVRNVDAARRGTVPRHQLNPTSKPTSYARLPERRGTFHSRRTAAAYHRQHRYQTLDEEISERRKAIHEFLMLNHTDEEVRE